MKKNFLPQIKKDIKHFLFSEEGKVTEQNIVRIGMGLTMLGIMLNATEAFSAHSSSFVNDATISRGKHVSHAAHGSHGSHSSHGSHGSHGSHSSHGSHGSHGSHSSHGSHGSHGSHSNHANHVSHAAHGSHGSHGQW